MESTDNSSRRTPAERIPGMVPGQKLRNYTIAAILVGFSLTTPFLWLFWPVAIWRNWFGLGTWYASTRIGKIFRVRSPILRGDKEIAGISSHNLRKGVKFIGISVVALFVLSVALALIVPSPSPTEADVAAATVTTASPVPTTSVPTTSATVEAETSYPTETATIRYTTEYVTSTPESYEAGYTTADIGSLITQYTSVDVAGTYEADSYTGVAETYSAQTTTDGLAAEIGSVAGAYAHGVEQGYQKDLIVEIYGYDGTYIGEYSLYYTDAVDYNSGSLSSELWSQMILESIYAA